MSPVLLKVAILWAFQTLINVKNILDIFVLSFSSQCLFTFAELEGDPSKNQESEEGRLIAPQEAFNKIADVVQEAIRKMEMVAEEKLRMVKKARLAVEASDLELKDKTREVAALQVDRQRKKQQIEELESIVRLKKAEAEMFELKANEARREAERLQRIALAKTEKSEEDYASRYLKQRLNEAEAEKQFMLEKMKLQESSRTSQSSSGMYNKIQDLLNDLRWSPGVIFHKCMCNIRQLNI